ncbi:unnamed protein product [Merluccius merluccius]
MLTDEVSQIQEVRYCLKTLRAQMAARQNQNSNHSKVGGHHQALWTVSSQHTSLRSLINHCAVNDNQDESVKLREATRRLHVQLKEAEKRHQEERDKLQAENSTVQRRLEEQTERLQQAQGLSEERVGQLEELKRLLGGMQVESTGLKEKMAAGEMELWQLRARTEQDREGEQRSEVLEKELAMLKEKIHHLDDMLKSQQRKVRHMIEQLQNSRTVIQERDRVIRDLEEKVAFLEAENREMQHHMEYFSGEEEPPPMTPSEKQPQIVYSKPLTPSTHHNQKSLPFIKVIEIKS